MELTLSNLKATLLKTIGQDILDQGFVFSKTSFVFRKKIGKNRAEINFLFFDYKPSWLEFRYSIDFYIHEIEKEAKLFFKFLKLEIDLWPTKTFLKETFILIQKNLSRNTE